MLPGESGALLGRTLLNLALLVMGIVFLVIGIGIGVWG